MRRRDFIKVIAGSTAAWPLTALAQSGGQRKIAILALGTPTNPTYQSSVTAFMEGLRDLGWVDGQKAHIDLRWGSSNADLEKSFAAGRQAFRLSEYRPPTTGFLTLWRSGDSGCEGRLL